VDDADDGELLALGKPGQRRKHSPDGGIAMGVDRAPDERAHRVHRDEPDRSPCGGQLGATVPYLRHVVGEREQLLAVAALDVKAVDALHVSPGGHQPTPDHRCEVVLSGRNQDVGGPSGQVAVESTSGDVGGQLDRQSRLPEPRLTGYQREGAQR